MESAQVKVRKVPESRIKCLENYYIVEPNNAFTTEFVHNQVIEAMAHEIAQKLYEFRKISSVKREDGSICYNSRIEIIVPETPENAIAKPEQTPVQ